MPYLTQAEYVARFGEAETLRLTDETRSGQIESAKVEEALSDSEEEVDAYIGKRYAVPLANVPNLVKGFVAVLARERLHKTKPTPTVEKEAERARKQLGEISRNLMVLPTDEGAAPQDGRPVADSASSGDGPTPIFTEQTLAGYDVPNYYDVPNWRR